MNTQLFRQKSIDKVSSPEQLNEYIRVSNPGIWMVLVAIIVLLVGVCVWGVVGHLDTTLTAVAVSEKGQTVVYVKETDVPSVAVGMPVTIGDQEYTVKAIASNPVSVESELSEYALHVGNLQQGEWVWAVTVDGQLPDGVYSANIVVESIAPMSFLLN